MRVEDSLADAGRKVAVGRIDAAERIGRKAGIVDDIEVAVERGVLAALPLPRQVPGGTLRFLGLEVVTRKAVVVDDVTGVRLVVSVEHEQAFETQVLSEFDAVMSEDTSEGLEVVVELCRRGVQLETIEVFTDDLVLTDDDDALRVSRVANQHNERAQARQFALGGRSATTPSASRQDEVFAHEHRDKRDEDNGEAGENAEHQEQFEKHADHGAASHRGRVSSPCAARAPRCRTRFGSVKPKGSTLSTSFSMKARARSIAASSALTYSGVLRLVRSEVVAARDGLVWRPENDLRQGRPAVIAGDASFVKPLAQSVSAQLDDGPAHSRDRVLREARVLDDAETTPPDVRVLLEASREQGIAYAVVTDNPRQYQQWVSFSQTKADQAQVEPAPLTNGQLSITPGRGHYLIVQRDREASRAILTQFGDMAMSRGYFVHRGLDTLERVTEVMASSSHSVSPTHRALALVDLDDLGKLPPLSPVYRQFNDVLRYGRVFGITVIAASADASHMFPNMLRNFAAGRFAIGEHRRATYNILSIPAPRHNLAPEEFVGMAALENYSFETSLVEGRVAWKR